VLPPLEELVDPPLDPCPTPLLLEELLDPPLDCTPWSMPLLLLELPPEELPPPLLLLEEPPLWPVPPSGDAAVPLHAAATQQAKPSAIFRP
jgi:hypothetical protein